MTRRTLAVVSAGLSQPSSTRLLADQLAAATRDELVRRGSEVELHVVDLREYAHDVVNNMLTGFAAGSAARGHRHGDRGGRAHRRHPDLQRLVQRAVQVLLRRVGFRGRWSTARC